MSRVLIVDDDVNIRRLLALYLTRDGYETEEAGDGVAAMEVFRRHPPDIILLDVMLPGLSGTEVLREVRRTSGIPVIMLTARDETIDKVLGLELGADDYITKPFDPKEVLARVKAVIRRFSGNRGNDAEQTLSFPNLTVSLSQYKVMYKGRELDVPPRELELLYFLASQAGKVFTREQLLEQVWGYDYTGDSRTVDVHIKRLREKLSDDDPFGIRTIRGVGYKFETA